MTIVFCIADHALGNVSVVLCIAEQALHVSGVLALVVLGVVLSNNRTSISPEVETFLHRYGYIVLLLLLFLHRLPCMRSLGHLR